MRWADSRPSHGLILVAHIPVFVSYCSLSRGRSCCVILACAFGVVALAARAASAQIGIDGSGLRIDPPVGSMKKLRDQNLVRQRFDFSCGAAALATLLRYGLGENITERQILVELFNLLSEDEKAVRHRTGFSLLDLQRVAQARGFNAQGFRLKADQLTLLGGPVLVFIEPRGYKHFAVLRGVHGDRVHLADPSRGNIRMAAYSFLQGWLQDDGMGIIFVVEPKSGPPKSKWPLALAKKGLPQPEIMTVRELLAAGNTLVRLLEPSR